AAETGRDRPLLERIVQRRLRLEEVAHGEDERRYELLQQQRLCCGCDTHDVLTLMTRIISARARPNAERWRRPPRRPAKSAETPSSPAASAGRSGSAARSPSPSRTGRT